MSSSGHEDKHKNIETTVRYPFYLEIAHQTFLNNVHDKVEVVKRESPYEDFEKVDVDDIFLQSGFTLQSFPALFDMFGKHMAGFDIETLFDDAFDKTVNSSNVSDLVISKSDMLDEEVSDKIYPKFSVGMRDLDAVESSSFVIGKSLIEQNKIGKISKFESEVKYNLLPNVIDIYSYELSWQRDIINYYGSIIQTYYNVKLDIEKFNSEKIFNNLFWPLTVSEYERSALGVLTGAGTSTTKTEQDERGNNILGGALSGAAVGTVLGAKTKTPHTYTAAGGILGAASSFF